MPLPPPSAPTSPSPPPTGGVKSGLHCLDTCVQQVVDHGWSHHITRLMVLSNLANLCGFSPRELTDWFWFGYVDAYDWVVEPNVPWHGHLWRRRPHRHQALCLRRRLHQSHVELLRALPVRPQKRPSLTKPCPFTSLYWTFLERNEGRLGSNFRMQMPYRTLHKKPESELVQLRARAKQAIDHLQSFSRPKY